jgi:uncharacterized membrane protein YjfL (UPF0719 family)
MELRALYVIAFGVGTPLGMLLLLQIVQRGLAADLAGGNVAQRLLRVGQVLGTFLVAAAVVKNCVEGESVGRDVIWAAAFGAVGVLLVSLTGHLGVRMLLEHRLPHEIARGNAAAGLAAGAHYVATSIVTSRAMAGSDLRSLGLAITFFVIGQVTLHLFVTLFRALTTYDDAEQIAGENMAAALSYAGLAIAVAIVIARAVDGDFTGWLTSLKGYGGVLASALALYPVRQLFVQTLLLRAPLTLRGGRLDTAIAVERSEGLGALEAASYVATALSIAHLA